MHMLSYSTYLLIILYINLLPNNRFLHNSPFFFLLHIFYCIYSFAHFSYCTSLILSIFTTYIFITSSVYSIHIYVTVETVYSISFYFSISFSYWSYVYMHLWIWICTFYCTYAVYDLAILFIHLLFNTNLICHCPCVLRVEGSI